MLRNNDNIIDEMEQDVKSKYTLNKEIYDNIHSEQVFSILTRYDVEIADKVYSLRFLTRKEVDNCLMLATEYYESIPEYKKHELLFNHEYMIRILAHALSKCPEDSLFIDGQYKLLNLSTVQFVEELFNNYNFMVNKELAECDKITNEELIYFIDKIQSDISLISIATRPQLIRALLYYVFKDNLPNSVADEGQV